MSARRVGAALVAVLLGAAVVAAASSTAATAADPEPSDSSVVVSGKGEFADLKVTVSQTRNLINQVIAVSWTGGTPTPITGFQTNFLQIMQCWGDDPAGPDRTQCQFGGLNGSSSVANIGAWVQSRQIGYGANLVDRKETLALPAGAFGNPFVPFWAAGKDPPVGAANTDLNDFFDRQVTNEIPVARTHTNGTGLEYFEVETVRQAAGLGCGEPVTVGGVTKGRSCWLVIVPRGSTEVNGSTPALLQSSPLSPTNWDNRIVVPLEFLPVTQSCPVGSSERGLVGHELAVDAVTSWQPALCTGGGSLYSYNQLPDDVVRNQLLGGSSPGLALMTNPISPDQVSSDQPLVYAPVALSGLAVAFNIERQPPDPVDGVPPTPEQELAGQRFTSLKLTPRLVAKLLTQSYTRSVEAPPDAMKNNPLGLLTDPEFLDLNPEYKGSVNPNKAVSDALVQLPSADVTSLLWSWVQADKDAREFITGTADPSGMVVNPNNRGLTLPLSTFPRNDQSCIDTHPASNVTAQICTLDAHPYTSDMHDAGRSASRGDTKEQTVVAKLNQVVPTAVGRQQAGQRAVLAIVDTATAARYAMPTAALRNAAGEFVSPTIASLQAGEVAMKPSAVKGVMVTDPSAGNPAVYPLAALSYAVIAPSTLDAAARKDYAAFLRYAAGPGQQPGINPGQLPPGMAPLPDALKAQTIAVATALIAPAPQPTSTAAVPEPVLNSIGRRGALGPASTAATPTPPGGGPGVPGPTTAPSVPSGPASTHGPTVVQQPVAGVRRTPPLPVPAVGALLLTILIAGALAATSSPVLQSPLIHRFGAAVRSLRRGVRPTER